MDPRMMRQWLAGQTKKAQVTEAKIQQTRLGIREGIVPQAQARTQAGMHATKAGMDFRAAVPTEKSDPCESCKQYNSGRPEACWKVCGEPRPQQPKATVKQYGPGGKLVGTSQVDDHTKGTIYEQLSPQEEGIAKKIKPALETMKKQYGEEKGTRVFYGTVRNMAKKGK